MSEQHGPKRRALRTSGTAARCRAAGARRREHADADGTPADVSRHHRRSRDRPMERAGRRTFFQAHRCSTRERSRAPARSRGSSLRIKRAGWPSRARSSDAVDGGVAAVGLFGPALPAGTNRNTASSCSADGDGRPARAETFINSGGRDLTLTLAGESPLQYFDAAPHVTVRAGSQVLATASAVERLRARREDPGGALAAADGMLTIETDQTFVPHDRSGSPDRRTLGLSIFRFEIR